MLWPKVYKDPLSNCKGASKIQPIIGCIENDICPLCKSELDTGYECNKCGYDAEPIVMLLTNIIVYHESVVVNNQAVKVIK